ncbi:MAG: IS4 family transposase [Planctomycetaceae bacterium]
MEARSRLLNCLAFYNIIAWRILYLTYLNRTAPEISCKVIFADHEWKPVWRIVHKKPLPKQPPSLGDFMALIAHLGGYNNRPSEKPTGPLPIWIGIRRMLDYSAAWLEFGPEK